MLEVMRQENRGRKVIVDQEIKACDKCRRCWEKVNKSVHFRTYSIYPVGNIPRIGKEIKTCPRCK